jgi:hypothetical protein
MCGGASGGGTSARTEGRTRPRVLARSLSRTEGVATNLGTLPALVLDGALPAEGGRRLLIVPPGLPAPSSPLASSGGFDAFELPFIGSARPVGFANQDSSSSSRLKRILVSLTQTTIYTRQIAHPPHCPRVARVGANLPQRQT